MFWFACWWCLFSNVAQATGSPWYLQIHGHGQHLCLNWHYVGLCILTAVLVSDVRNEFSYPVGIFYLKCILSKETLQELRMLSSVTINCKATQIVINTGSQLSVL